MINLAYHYSKPGIWQNNHFNLYSCVLKSQCSRKTDKAIYYLNNYFYRQNNSMFDIFRTWIWKILYKCPVLGNWPLPSLDFNLNKSSNFYISTRLKIVILKCFKVFILNFIKSHICKSFKVRVSYYLNLFK